MNTKKLCHVDMDAYYVSIEIRDNPALADKPVAVGGNSDRRGVLSTCNYIARRYGVHSAMPTKLAMQKCPSLIVLPGRMQIYKDISQQIRGICDEYSDKIEPLSLDEMYLDLSDSSLHQGSATLIAKEIRDRIFLETGLTASAGIAPLKFLAKIASDINKPNNQFTIAPHEVEQFIDSLELKKIPGVGKVTQEKLEALGLFKGRDIINCDESLIYEKFGKFGRTLWKRCHGIDDREIEVSRIRKSVGVERTFERDVASFEQLHRILEDKLYPELKLRSEKHLKSRRMNKLGVKIKFADFRQTTKEMKFQELSLQVLIELLKEALQRGEGKAVRLLGIHIGLEDSSANGKQLQLCF